MPDFRVMAGDRLIGIGPLAAAYVMLIAVVGPILTRFADPIAGLIQRRQEKKLEA